MIWIAEGFPAADVHEMIMIAQMNPGADLDPYDANDLQQRVHDRSAFVIENVLTRRLGFSGRGLQWLLEVATRLNDDQAVHFFPTMQAFQASVIRLFVDGLAASVVSVAGLWGVLPREKFRQAAFIFHLCRSQAARAGRTPVTMEDLCGVLKKVRANRSAIDLKSVEAQVTACIRMNTAYAEVLRSEGALTNFAEGQRGVLDGLFAELKTFASLKKMLPGAPALSSGVFRQQEVDLVLPLAGKKTALIEVAASIPKLLDKLGPGGAAQRAGYESIVRREPHKYVLGYSAGVGHWFELFAGDHSPAVRVHRANRGLLVEGSFQDPAALQLLITKAAELKAALKLTSDTFLAQRMSASRILFKTFVESDVRKLKAAL